MDLAGALVANTFADDGNGRDATIDLHGVHYDLVASAIDFLRTNALAQPSLEQVATHVGLSPDHFQRLFARWAGVSPKRFLQYLTKEHAKAALRRSEDVLAATLAAGLSAPSRLHDLIVTCEAMTPGEVRTMGAGVCIGYGVTPTPFGAALVGWTPRGVCSLEFCNAGHTAGEATGEGTGEAALKAAGETAREAAREAAGEAAGETARAAGLEARLRAEWPLAQFQRDDGAAVAIGRKIFAVTPTPGALHLVLRGTNFQIKVWEALLRIDAGQVLSYSQLAASAGVPKAQRAVGSAMAANVLAYLIPCHRVIQSGGDFGSYRWGATRKAALIAWEAARMGRMGRIVTV
jgi:AraC family transcriptional regulator of adaptative response/methylated-DNA-[protein]-cysteine methyltransferase